MLCKAGILFSSYFRMQAAAEPLLNEINTKKLDLQALDEQIKVSISLSLILCLFLSNLFSETVYLSHFLSLHYSLTYSLSLSLSLSLSHTHTHSPPLPHTLRKPHYDQIHFNFLLIKSLSSLLTLTPKSLSLTPHLPHPSLSWHSLQLYSQSSWQPLLPTRLLLSSPVFVWIIWSVARSLLLRFIRNARSMLDSLGMSQLGRHSQLAAVVLNLQSKVSVYSKKFSLTWALICLH